MENESERGKMLVSRARQEYQQCTSVPAYIVVRTKRERKENHSLCSGINIVSSCKLKAPSAPFTYLSPSCWLLQLFTAPLFLSYTSSCLIKNPATEILFRSLLLLSCLDGQCREIRVLAQKECNWMYPSCGNYY